MVTIHIGIGFVLGVALTIVFLVSYLRSIWNEEKLSKFGEQIEAMLVKAVARFSVSLLKDERVHQAVTKLIADGINAFLNDPEAQRHLEKVMSTSNDNARELGKHVPKLVGAFSKGLLEGTFGSGKKKGPGALKNEPDSLTSLAEGKEEIETPPAQSTTKIE